MEIKGHTIKSGQDKQKYLGYYALGTLVALRPLELILNFIPQILIQISLVVGLVVLYKRMTKFRRWNDEIKWFKKFAISFIVLVVTLLVENFFVWAVAASDVKKYDREIEPLQDNGEIALKYLAQQSNFLRFVIEYKLIDTTKALLLLLYLPFSVMWDQVPYSGFGLMSRTLMAIVVCRVWRVASFMSTVLPHPRGYGCYPEKFPPVPKSVWEFIYAGTIKLKGLGGCNDLVYSGHGVFVACVPCVYGAFYSQKYVSYILWGVYIQHSIRTVYERWHYSVDMLIAGLIMKLVFDNLNRLYDTDKEKVNLERQKADPVPWVPLVFLGFVFFMLAVLIFVAKA